jgi:hypothetical protein
MVPAAPAAAPEMNGREGWRGWSELGKRDLESVLHCWRVTNWTAV